MECYAYPSVSAVSAFRRQLATPPNEDCRPSSSRHPSLVKTSHRSDPLAQYASNHFPCIEKVLVGGTPHHLLYASTASAHVGAFSGGNPRHLRRLLSQSVAEHLMRQAIKQSCQLLHRRWKSKQRSPSRNPEDQTMLSTSSRMATERKQACVHTLLLPCVFLWINHGAAPGMAP